MAYLRKTFWVCFLLGLGFVGLVQVSYARVPQNIHLPVDSVQIVFLANINANYENCLCGNPPLGGLDRMLTLVERWRQKNSRLLVFDGGDFLNAYPYPAVNRLILRLYRLLQPDVLVLGDQELQKGNDSLQAEMRSFPIINSNVILAGSPLASQMTVRLASRRLLVFSYLDSSAFLWENPARDVRLKEDRFARTYRASLNPKVFRIVIFHGEQDRMKRFLQKYPRIHLLLLAHAQIRTLQLKKIPYLIAPGSDSEYLTRISLIFQKGKRLPRIFVKTIPVGLQIAPNSKARNIIEAFKAGSK